MSNSSKKLLVAAVSAAIAIVVLLFVTARFVATQFEPEVRRQAIRYLEQRFESKVEIGALQIRLPNFSPAGLLLRHGVGSIARVEGRDVSLRYRGQQDRPPLFTIGSFHFDVDLGMLRAAEPRVAHVAIEGMTIVVPPKGSRPQFGKTGEGAGRHVMIEKVDISNARLVVMPRDPARKPLDFALHTIHLESAGAGRQMKYQATLTNPKPPGKIVSQGMFGPWNRDEPGDSPLEGDYDFSNADLGVFKGIAGILHSSGRFAGSLSSVNAHGEATVPDFRLTNSGNRVPLATRFDVLVDGTNGDTILQPVHARLGDTEFVTSGGIVKHEKAGRRAIDLQVQMPGGNIQDLLRLAVKGKPFMSGTIQMQADISIPPLAGSVRDKLKLAGTFAIAKGEFLRDKVQDKIDELSRRGQGRPTDRNVDNVFSQMSGAFRLDNQVMTFTRLGFAVPGAGVNLHGSYSMSEDALDFHGDLKLEAKVSQTVTGWKHWLAKPIDPIFAKNGAGTFLRIQVVGSSKQPQFGKDRGE